MKSCYDENLLCWMIFDSGSNVGFLIELLLVEFELHQLYRIKKIEAKLMEKTVQMHNYFLGETNAIRGYHYRI